MYSSMISLSSVTILILLLILLLVDRSQVAMGIKRITPHHGYHNFDNNNLDNNHCDNHYNNHDYSYNRKEDEYSQNQDKIKSKSTTRDRRYKQNNVVNKKVLQSHRHRHRHRRNNDNNTTTKASEDSNEENNFIPSEALSRKHRPLLFISSLHQVVSSSFSTCKAVLKGTYDLCAIKHVFQHQILGEWKLQQEIKLKDDVVLDISTYFDFQSDNHVITFNDNDEEYESKYKFEERSWPRRCTLDFESKLAIDPKKEPLHLIYRGYFKRSLMNPKILMMRGKIYRTEGRMFWKRQVKCGKFSAIRSRYQ